MSSPARGSTRSRKAAPRSLRLPPERGMPCALAADAPQNTPMSLQADTAYHRAQQCRANADLNVVRMGTKTEDRQAQRQTETASHLRHSRGASGNSEASYGPAHASDLCRK